MDRLLRFAGTGLAAAVALYIAVHLLEAIIPELVGLGVMASVVYVAVAIIRDRRSRW